MRVGIVGAGDEAARLAGAIDGAETGEAAAVLDRSPEVVVGVGQPAVSALVAAGVDVPLLPIDAGDGLESVAADRAPAVVEQGLDGGFTTRERPVVGVAVDGEPAGRGAYDAMLVTAEPARISEFGVETAAGEDRFRADGVAVATPAGSAGYTRALGGPVLDPGAGGLLVVPVAAFTVRPTVRVAADAVTVTVLREEGDISLLVDGEDRGPVPSGRPVTVAVDGVVDVVVPEGG